MMKKSKITYIVFAVALLMGCQPTPEELVVKSKVDDTYIDKINESDKSKDERTGSSEPKSAYTVENDRWEEVLSTKDETLYVQIQADVIVPQVETFSAVEVLPSKMTQEQVDGFLDRFFPDRKAIVSDEIAQIPTKTEIEANILMLKEWIATSEVNTDKNGVTNHERWQEEIDFYSEQLADAPDEHPEMLYDITKYSAYPLMEINWEEGMTIKELNSRLKEMKERIENQKSELIHCDIQTDESNSYRIYALRSDEPYINHFSFSSNTKHNIMAGFENDQDIPELNMSFEQAKYIADEAAAVLGLDYMTMVHSTIGESSTYTPGNKRDIVTTKLYHFVYTRSINGCNITYAFNRIDPMKLTYKPWQYEYFEIWIDDDGIQGVSLSRCPSRLGDVLAGNMPLIAFEDIQEKARQSFNLGILSHSLNSREVERLIAENRATVYENNIVIDKVVLGYMKVKQGTGDNRYIIIPVWDFIGRENIHMDVRHKKVNSVSSTKTELPEFGYGDQHSFLTVNAIDGSIIDRSLGY